MNNIKKILIASIAALSTSVALAHDNGLYIGGGYGLTDANGVCDTLNDIPTSHCDDDDDAWTVFGGYQFTRNLALEAGYSDLGNYDGSIGPFSGDFNTDAYDLSVLGILPLNNMFSVYARGGYSWVDSETNIDAPVNVDDGGTEGAWVYGLGASINATDNIEVRADWRRYNDIDNNSAPMNILVDNVDLDVYSLQAVYHFGPHAAPVAAPAEEVSLNIQVLFDTDKSAIKPEYQGEIQKAVDFLTAHPEAKAVIEGHTDSTASDAYNQALSERRANSVMDALIAKGVDAGRLSAAGYGESKPVADNATKDGRAQNRRVVAEFSGVTIKAN